MSWSWSLGEIAGIRVYMHATFLILLAWVGAAHLLAGHGAGAALIGIAFILLLFGCVVLHELGHALTARRYGIRTRDITLYPIGGVARLERMPEEPYQELVVALAGPAVNVVIAAALYALLRISYGLVPLESLSVSGGPLLERLMVVNVFLVLFNLLPAFPMDGGRVLRALLATRMEYTRATNIAASVGQAMAFFFGFLGLTGNPFLLFIAFFVWIGAAQEAGIVQMRYAMGGVPVTKAMVTEFRTLSPEDPLSHGVDLMLSGAQQDFPVVSDGSLVGVLPRSKLLAALSERGQDGLVREAMEREFEVVDPYEMLESAFTRLQGCNCSTLPVVREGRLVGLITTENVGEFLMVQTALRGKPGSPVPA